MSHICTPLTFLLYGQNQYIQLFYIWVIHSVQYSSLNRSSRLQYVCVCFQVQQHWTSYMENIDRMLEEAFRVNIKRSLQELSKAINGDGKISPNPLFRVEVVLTPQTARSTAQVNKTHPLFVKSNNAAAIINTVYMTR